MQNSTHKNHMSTNYKETHSYVSLQGNVLNERKYFKQNTKVHSTYNFYLVNFVKKIYLKSGRTGLNGLYNFAWQNHTTPHHTHLQF